MLALLFSVSTGWRIASMTSEYPLLRWLDILILQGNVVRWHFISATLLTALVIGYLAFIWRMGLSGRLAVRWTSLRSNDRNTRWLAINKLIYWVSLALLLGAAITGTLMYFYSGLLPTEPLMQVHQLLSWAFVAYIILHVAAQLALGGFRQLLKIVSPRLAYGLGAVLTVAAGVATAAVAYVADSQSMATLRLVKISTPPQLDGNPGDVVWQQAPEAVVHTARGFNLKGGEVDVHIRALHDGQRGYFQFRWQDATCSQKHIPLVKTEGGWKLLHSNYYNNDENDYYEDKFAVLLARSPVTAGNATQLGSKPFPDKPGPSNGLGLHATTDGSLADMWHWKSVRTGTFNQFDDNHFGPPLDAKEGKRYTGGYSQDPKSAGGYEQNFVKIEGSPYVKLKFLPKDLAAQQARMGTFNPDVNVSDTGQFFMLQSDVQPYSAQADAAIAVGTVIPSVLIDKAHEGDRGDVSAHAQWKDGWWTIEASRKLDTGSAFDQPLAQGMYMWVSVFDHNQVRHTRHMRPLRLQLD